MSLRVFSLYALAISVLIFTASPFHIARALTSEVENFDYLSYLEEFKNLGVTEGSGTHFEISNSEYLNISLDSTEEVSLRLESIPETISISLEASTGATYTDFTFYNFLPNTTYYKYEDGYETLTVFTTDENGSYTYTQDISQTHNIFIQTHKSTKFIRNDATGGDCNTIGIWDIDTKVCTLNTDLNETIQVDEDGITLDGAGHTITGSNTGTGIFLLNRSGVTVKNLNIQNFSYGLFLVSSSNNTLINNNLTNTIQGITLDNSHNNTLNDNSIEVHTLSFYRHQGIIFFNSNENTIFGNSILMNADLVSPYSRQGVVIFDSNDNIFTHTEVVKTGQAVLYFDSFRNIFRRGTIDQSKLDAFLIFNSDDSQVYNNNFTNNISYLTNFSSSDVFSVSLPHGGNYWDTFDNPSEGCEDVNGDDMCDATFTFTGGEDLLPWKIPNGWPDTDPPPLAPRDPLIIIPGITGSYLNKNYDDLGEIWPNVSRLLLPGPDNFLNYLALNIDGTENPDFPILVGDIIREESGSHVFDGLISDLENAGYVENTDLFVFPYDWRMSNTENVILLQEKIDEILVNSSAEKVDIVAHSMGGILAKTYILNEGIEKIDQLVFLGTPHLGAPKAFKALMYGDDMGFSKYSLGLNPSRMKFISQNMSSAYELLPSEKYISKSTGYVTNAQDKNNIFTYNYLQTKELMTLNGRNGPMLQGGETLHNDIDDLDLSGLEVHNFVGCGSHTVGEITLKRKFGWFASGFKTVDDYDIKYVNGDETVPLISADDVVSANIYYTKAISHGKLPSADGVKEDIVAILSGDALPYSENILTDTSTCKISGKNVSTHSPVELHIYDEEGNHTGPNVDGDIEVNIPGVAYDVIEGEKFAFLPDGINYQVITKATEVGGYNLVIKEQNADDEIVSTKEWTLIPLKTIDAEGEIWVGPDYREEDYQVAMDNNGDGIFEENVIPNKGEEINVKAYLKAFRIMIEQLDIKQEIKKALLAKIDKLEKKLEKDKKGKLNNKIIKFIQKFGDLKKEHDNNHEHEEGDDDYEDDDKKSKDNKVLSEKELFIKFIMNLLEEVD
ncbi:MAG: right-handed parallel beta-helix repeat-containing protein [Candidatus Pacebacteria bacterium]|nr:right-handed parallel beta-helix repeat-containing protein [Candidatus Paceibacterota bacterium]